ncbi:ABC-three component system protein [Streptomonospora alba]|uniref:ABC-three component system protein n=1 Tax=Streptomonospora alba TaxID=183763 RepID=UPI0012ED68D7|nr:ABC-three component system protein [Streptomonospora alba]
MGMPDAQDRAWFRSVFMARSHLKSSFEWQNFVTEFMQARHPGKFYQVDPSGRGDKGCDGWVEGLMLACYGATNPKPDYVKNKMKTDFTSARTYWKDKMQKWAFVHNNYIGLAYMVVEGMMDLQEEADDVEIQCWPPQVLWDHCTEDITREQLCDLLGAPPTDHPAGMTYIARCVESLARTRLSTDLEGIPPVPYGKIEHNEFSDEVVQLILRIQPHTDHVRYFFQRSSPGEQDSVSQNLRERYDGLLAKLQNPDAVFHALCDELIAEAFPGREGGAEERSAAMMVVTYFFEQCEIFKAPPEGS